MYSTYLGGSGTDLSVGIKVDSTGSAAIAGFTTSVDYPQKNSIQPNLMVDTNVFVSKLSADGAGLVYSTYLGGAGPNFATAIADDPNGKVYVAGTPSAKFQTLNAFQPSPAGGQDAFLARLSPAGSLTFSTYFGGSRDDVVDGLVVDSSGNVYGTGSTNSPTLFPGAAAPAGGQDGFVVEFDSNGKFLQGSLFGGKGDDVADLSLTIELRLTPAAAFT